MLNFALTDSSERNGRSFSCFYLNKKHNFDYVNNWFTTLLTGNFDFLLIVFHLLAFPI